MANAMKNYINVYRFLDRLQIAANQPQKDTHNTAFLVAIIVAIHHFSENTRFVSPSMPPMPQRARGRCRHLRALFVCKHFKRRVSRLSLRVRPFVNRTPHHFAGVLCVVLSSGDRLRV